MRSPENWRVFADADALADAVVERILALAKTALRERGVFHLALSGGSTPRTVYERLARDPRADCAHWHAWFGDERCVPPTDADSNHHMAAESGLLSRLPREQVHRMRGEAAPAQEASRYESELLQVLGNPARLDLALLGLGTDGHTASLFPGTEALGSRDLVAVGQAPQPPHTRLTLTIRMLAEARSLLFLVSGAGKAPTLAGIRAGNSSTPASRLHPRDGDLSWFADRAAAGG